jgi:hypothetical protein
MPILVTDWLKMQENTTVKVLKPDLLHYNLPFRMAFYHRAYEILRMFWIASFLAMTERSTLSSLRGTKQSRNIKKEETYNNEGCTTLAGILDCFVPRNDERASDERRE